MTAIKTHDIRSALLSKGFRLDNRDHQYLWLYVGAKLTGVRTKLSHGTSDYGDPLLDKVKKQLRITKPQLLALVDCSLTYEEYVAYLVQEGHVKIP